MPEIFDVLAKVSWDTNTEELNKQLSEESKVLAELEQRGKRLETQMQKTNDPKKVAAVNQQLAQTKKAQDSIIEGQKKQLTQTDLLVKKQAELFRQLQKTNDPKGIRQITSALAGVGRELDKINKKQSEVGGLLSGAGGQILAGIGIGAGAFGITAAVQGLMGVLSDSLAEIEEAERAARNLGLALKATGNERYFDGLIIEASKLAEQYNRIYDNDEIVAAQTELAKYGRFTRNELSEITKVAIELASAYRISVPEAANKLIDILGGRGASTLRDFGITTKEAATEQERLALVIGKFGQALQGQTEEFAKSTEGIRKQNELLIANTKEQIGEKLLPIYISALQGINQALNGEWDSIAKNMADGLSNAWMKLSLTGQAFNIAKDFWKYALGIEDPKVQSDVVKGYKDFILAATMEAKKQAANNQKLNQGLTPEEIEAEKARAEALAKKRAELQKAAEQRAKERKQLDESVKLKLTITDAEIDAAAKGIQEGIEKLNKSRDNALDKLGVKLLDLPTEKDEPELARELADRLDNIKRKAALIASTREAIGETQAANEKRAQERQQLFDEVQNASSVAQDLISIEQRKTDKLIALQEERVNAARNNSAASLKIEQDRLNELIAKRERFERTQRTIDAAVIAANQAVAISGAIATIANSKNPVLIAANVIAILAGIGATIAAIRSINADSGFKEGGYTGDGDPSDESTAIGKRPYKYHKKEFVMDEGLTSKHRDMFEGLHKRNLVVQRMDDGSYYLAPDTHRMAEDFESTRESASLMPLLSEMSQMRKLLQQREVNISQNFDADGFGQAVAVQMGQINLKRKRA